jgi:hypothetical protein
LPPFPALTVRLRNRRKHGAPRGGRPW